MAKQLIINLSDDQYSELVRYGALVNSVTAGNEKPEVLAELDSIRESVIGSCYGLQLASIAFKKEINSNG